MRVRSSRSPLFRVFAAGATVACLSSSAASAGVVPTNDDRSPHDLTTRKTVVLKAAPKASAVAASPDSSFTTLTPIKHVILIIGENHSFDNVFATYQPPQGQTVFNLLSEGIVNSDGTPGPNVARAAQWQAQDSTTYSINPQQTSAYANLPQLNTGSAPQTPYIPSLWEAKLVEPGLPSADYGELVTGGTGLAGNTLDTRFPATLANAPIDSTSSISYDDYANSPVHRFFQMWQQLDCSAAASTPANPSGCSNNLFPWVETSVGTGSNGVALPSGFNDQSTDEGATSMMFFNVAKGDAPYLTQLAQQYTLSDNFHQSVMGGTGANHIMLGYASPIFYADSNGSPATPPAGQIENPNPQPGSNNYYTEDGYGDATTGNGGSYVNCADKTQPGVAPIQNYLNALPYKPFNGGDCLANAYYLVNNYNPGYLGDGTAAPLGSTQFTVPPTTQNNLALLLNKHKVTWKYYGEAWAFGTEAGSGGTYCNICDPFLYSTQIMTDSKLRARNTGIEDLYSDIKLDLLPAVSIVKPDEIVDGHPASSKLELFEGFTQKIVEMVQANPKVWADTAIVITFDEGGGYYDSGYVQPIDFFGDGTRIPLLVVSPYSAGGRVIHSYGDHVSFDKFVEANWMLNETISPQGRDNLPNPVASTANPYVPANQPAIGDMMDMFQFSSQ